MNNFMFLMNVYNDSQQAKELCRQLTDYFPKIPIHVVFDGEETEYNNFPYYENVQKYLISSRTKTINCGCHWIRNYLEVFLNSRRLEPYLIKLDPDCQVYRKFKGLMPNADYFGTLVDGHIQGGVKGFSRNFAQLLCKQLWGMTPIANRQKPELLSEDLTIMKFIENNKNIIVQEWNEVCSWYGKAPINPYVCNSLKYAITHPIEK